MNSKKRRGEGGNRENEARSTKKGDRWPRSTNASEAARVSFGGEESRTALGHLFACKK